MEAFLGLVAAGRIRPGELITHRFAFGEAQRAYEALSRERPVAIVLSYPRPAATTYETAADRTRRPRPPPRRGEAALRADRGGQLRHREDHPRPDRGGLQPGRVASASGFSAESARQRFEFESPPAGPEAVLDGGRPRPGGDRDPARLARRVGRRGARARVAVYVEKPLALDWEELAAVRAHCGASARLCSSASTDAMRPAARELKLLPGPRLMSYASTPARCRPSTGPTTSSSAAGD